LALARKLIFFSIDMETAAHVNDVYQPRNLRVSDYFKLARDHFEELEMLYPPLRPVGLCRPMGWKRAPRAYGSERMIATNSVAGSGDPMPWM